MELLVAASAAASAIAVAWLRSRVIDRLTRLERRLTSTRVLLMRLVRIHARRYKGDIEQLLRDDDVRDDDKEVQ